MRIKLFWATGGDVDIYDTKEAAFQQGDNLSKHRHDKVNSPSSPMFTVAINTVISSGLPPTNIVEMNQSGLPGLSITFIDRLLPRS